MSDSKNSGIGTVGALTLIFVVNKLTNAGDIAGWSWWWVFSPVWIALGLTLVIAATAGAIGGVVKVLDDRADRKAEKKRQAARAARLKRL